MCGVPLPCVRRTYTFKQRFIPKKRQKSGWKGAQNRTETPQWISLTWVCFFGGRSASVMAVTPVKDVASPDIDECSVCQDIIGYAQGKINEYGCGLITDAYAAAACEAIGLGPEDPLSDLCAFIIVHYCPDVLKYLEDHVPINSICSDLGYCSAETGKEMFLNAAQTLRA